MFTQNTNEEIFQKRPHQQNGALRAQFLPVFLEDFFVSLFRKYLMNSLWELRIVAHIFTSKMKSSPTPTHHIPYSISNTNSKFEVTNIGVRIYSIDFRHRNLYYKTRVHNCAHF